jgi:hypothetical protein
MKILKIGSVYFSGEINRSNKMVRVSKEQALRMTPQSAKWRAFLLYNWWGELATIEDL